MPLRPPVGPRSLRVVRAFAALPFFAFAALAQGAPRAPGDRASLPIGLHIGIPQGAFADNVDIAGGLGGGLLLRLAGEIGLRAELGFMVYGSETRRVELGTGPLGRITVDVTTTNQIIGGGLGLQLGLPGPRPRPYVGGTIGFSNFRTTSSVEGSNSSNEPFASSDNYSDGTFAKNALAGLYLPVGRSGRVLIDLGARYTWNGEEVRYLTEGDIVDNPTGPPTITPRRSRADILTVNLGVAVRF